MPSSRPPSPVTGGSASAGPGVTFPPSASAGPSAASSSFSKNTGQSSFIKIDALPKLVGASNWKTWNLLVTQFLRIHGAIDLINPSLTKPSQADADYNAWVQADANVTLIFLTTVDTSLHHLIDADNESAAQIYSKLKANYAATTTLSSFLKFKQYFFTSIDGSRPLNEQLEERGRLWQEVDNSGILDDKQLLKIFGLLSVIPDTFANIVEPILAVTAPKDLKYDDIRSRLIDEATRKESPTSVSAVKVSKPATSTSSSKKKLVCNFCGYKGHVEAECRKKKAAMEDVKGKKKEKGKGKDSSGSPSSSNGSAAVHVVSANDTSSEAAHVANIDLLFYASGATPWMLDSGCTKHISNNLTDFSEYKPFATPSFATLADAAKTSMSTLGSGKVTGIIEVSGKALTVQLDNVLYCPSIAYRLISVSALDSKGFTTVFSDGEARITKKNATIGTGTLKGGQYWLGITLPTTSVASSTHTRAPPIDIVHQRFGHLNWEALQRLRLATSPVQGLTISESAPRSPHQCEGCRLGKSTRRIFSQSSTPRASHPFDLIHSDLAGPMQNASVNGGKLYMLTYIDDFSDNVWIYFLKHKDEQETFFEEFRQLVKTQFGREIKILRSDRGGEYQSKRFIQRLKDLGIVHQRTNPDTPQQNGKAERFNRTIMEAALSMLLAAGMSKGFWEEAVKTAVHVRNRAPKKSLDWRTPFEIITGSKPDVSHFRVFGCLAYRHIHKDHRRKLDAHAQPLTFVGYEAGSKGYRLWDKHTHKIVSSTDVVFDELVFPDRPETIPQPSSNIPNPTPPSTFDLDLSFPSTLS